MPRRYREVLHTFAVSNVPLNLQSFLAAKRDGKPHLPGELANFVQEIVAGRIPDYQVSAWLMAAYIRGLDADETRELAHAMSGGNAAVEPGAIDKHSTGGVGDAVTLLFLPIVAACGAIVQKTSGRSLGFTGGTLDKMAAIPGFRTDLSSEELREIAERVGCSLGGQSQDLAPADRVLYALRDATATVGSIPLIAASVMSKKLAGSAECIVLDVKCGSGAFMKKKQDAFLLADTLVKIGTQSGRKMRALVTDMSQPLANSVGNALEVSSAIHELQTGCNGRLGQLAVRLANEALALAGRRENAEEAVRSGLALKKMAEWIRAQGGDDNVIGDTSLLPSAPESLEILSDRKGYLSSFDCMTIGECAREMGAGRLRKDDVVNPSVGIEVHRKVGDAVEVGQPIFTVRAPSKPSAEIAAEQLKAAIHISDSAVEPPPLVLAN
jgi:pyrimidine-nucleoside phosphorylase